MTPEIDGARFRLRRDFKAADDDLRAVGELDAAITEMRATTTSHPITRTIAHEVGILRLSFILADAALVCARYAAALRIVFQEEFNSEKARLRSEPGAGT